RSSSGEITERPFVRTRVQIGPVVKVVEVSLVSREKMLFRMLLGRKALEKDFLVDVGRRRVLTSVKPKDSSQS
ncbi:MAG: ATP-dependent zinc protease, partial [Candidatus Sumerlaeia bacterium]|nr:ATP-dependent zinc protease [Candidatus Sumerlaeia bacterium]